MPERLAAARWLALLILTSVPPLAARTEVISAATTCDARARTANLNFTLEDITGTNVTLSDYQGRVILLDFWATWCAPCKIEIPGFVEMYAQYTTQGFVVLGVSVNDPVARLAPFAAQFKMNYPVLVGAGRTDLLDAFAPLAAFPTAFLIARDGTICKRHVGLTPKEEFDREIKALLQSAR